MVLKFFTCLASFLQPCFDSGICAGGIQLIWVCALFTKGSGIQTMIFADLVALKSLWETGCGSLKARQWILGGCRCTTTELFFKLSFNNTVNTRMHSLCNKFRIWQLRLTSLLPTAPKPDSFASSTGVTVTSSQFWVYPSRLFSIYLHSYMTL